MNADSTSGPPTAGGPRKDSHDVVVIGARYARRSERRIGPRYKSLGVGANSRNRRSTEVAILTLRLRNRRSQVRILSGALKIWLSDCDRR